MAKWLELDRKLYGLQEDSSSSSGGDEGDGGGGGDENWEMQRKKKNVLQLWNENRMEIVCLTKYTSAIPLFRIDKMQSMHIHIVNANTVFSMNSNTPVNGIKLR